MKKPKKFYTFLYRHFKSHGHSPSKIIIQPVEKIIYNPNSSTRLKTMRRHETKLKWIKLCNHLFLKALMIIYTLKVSFLKCQVLMFFCFGYVKNVKIDLMVNVKTATFSAKFVLKNA